MDPLAQWSTLVAMLIFFLILAWISWRGYRKTEESVEDHFIARGTIGALVIFLTSLGTAYSAFTFLGGPGYIYNKGIAGVIILVGIAPITFPLMTMIGQRVWLLGKRYNYVTPADLLADRYPSAWVRTITALICIVFPIFYIGVQYTGCGYIMNVLTDGLIPYEVGVIITGIFMSVYIALGGMRAVAWGDVLMAVLLVFGMLIIAAFGVATVGLDLFQKAYAVKPQAFVITRDPVLVWTITIGSALSLPVWPQLWTKYYATKNQRGTWGIGFGEQFGEVFVLGLCAILIGVSGMVLFPGLVGAEADRLTVLIASMMPIWAVAPISIAALAAALSTADAISLMIASVFTRDIYQRLISPTASERTAGRVGRILCFIVSFLALIFALNPPGMIVDIILDLSWPGVLVLLPPLLGALFWKRANTAGALGSLILGLVAVLATTYIWDTPFNIYQGIWGFVFGIIGLVLFSLLTKPPDPQIVEKFHGFFDKIPLRKIRTAEELQEYIKS
ncbi:MAG: sodium:solute symporter family protein [Candidatus Methanomethyliaceae archaeon]